MTSITAFCMLIVGLVAGSTSLAQIQTPPDLVRYHALVTAYRDQKGDAIKEIADWDRRRMADLFPVIDDRVDPLRPWTRTRFEAAVMLHSDAALELLGKDREDRALEHFMFADLLLRKAEHTGISLFGGRWFVAVSRHLRNTSPLHIVERFLELGRNRYPKNASIWYESGTFQELLAGRPSLQRLPAFSRDAESLSRLRVEVAVRDMVQRRDKHLDAAAGLLRASIAIDPSIAEARLHLGRVVMLQRSDRDGLTTFNTLATDPGSPFVAYLASLFAGAVHERQGRLEQAADAYAAAVTIWPGSQAAHIALSAVLQRAGRGDEARAALATVLSETREPPSEPLWGYFFEPEDEARERLNELRVEARQ